MKRVVCCVYDSATQLFGQPIFVPHRGAALRSFKDEVNRAAPDNQLGNHPEDFTLYQLAHFDDETGEFETAKELIARGKDLKESQS